MASARELDHLAGAIGATPSYHPKMTAPLEHLALAGDFPAPTREQWRTLVSAVLRLPPDTDPESALSSTTYDGIGIRPLYTAADAPSVPLAAPGQAPYVRGAVVSSALGWDVRQRHVGSDLVAVNAAVLDDLDNGVTSIWLTLGPGGVPVGRLADALRGVYLDLAPIVLDAGAETVAATEAFLELAGQLGVPLAELRGSFGADPLAAAARSGTAPDLAELPVLARLGAGTGVRSVTVDGSLYHDAGGSDSDELAAAAAAGVAYLRVLADGGVADPFEQLEFRYAVGADQFLAIAKLRAARRIWARIGELSGVPAPQHQHAVTSAAMLTTRDPWVNLLRATLAGFAAAVGGAEAITVAPFDAAIGAPDDFARHLARNTQALLHDESSLGRVEDPAGGSWYVESLTDELAEVAWAKFTELERAGGAVAALESGRLGALLQASREARRHDVATRRAPITGVTEFPLLTEDPVRRAPRVTPSADARLPSWRYAQDFEVLRDRSDAHLAATGARPRVLLTAVGSGPGTEARLTFARNLFLVGGIEAVSAQPGLAVVCLCGSDQAYADEGEAAVAAARADCVQRLLLAGAPSNPLAVDDHIYTGVDALAILRTTLADLGVR